MSEQGLTLDQMAPLLKGFGIDETQIENFRSSFGNFQKDFINLRKLIAKAYELNADGEEGVEDKIETLLNASLELLDKMSGVSSIKL